MTVPLALDARNALIRQRALVVVNQNPLRIQSWPAAIGPGASAVRHQSNADLSITLRAESSVSTGNVLKELIAYFLIAVELQMLLRNNLRRIRVAPIQKPRRISLQPRPRPRLLPRPNVGRRQPLPSHQVPMTRSREWAGAVHHLALLLDRLHTERFLDAG